MGFGNKQEKLNNYDVSWYESYPLCHFLKMNTRKGGILWNSFVKITRGGLQNFTHETFFSEKKQHIILIFFLIEALDRRDGRAQLKRQLVSGTTHHSRAKTHGELTPRVRAHADQMYYCLRTYSRVFSWRKTEYVHITHRYFGLSKTSLSQGSE